MRRGTAKDALEGIRWKDRVEDWTRVEVVVRHHGAPGGRKRVGSERITDLGAAFFEVDGETRIPYHRIQRVALDGADVYVRGSSSENRS